MKSLVYSFIIFLTSCLYLYSCANRTVPTGGPKDTIPPKLVTVVPEDKSTNFNGNKIVLVFDEFIKTKEINSQLIITPRLLEDFEHKINKTTLTIDLNEKLDSNTTYSFYFQETVQDIHESIPAEDLVIAFSTGDYIDSLFIEGKVRELMTNKSLPNAVVALYPAHDTLDLFNSKPQYFTRTKDDGSFKIENLKNASYRLYAFEDKNKNLTAQSESEAYGFLADSIVLDSSITGIDIPVIARNVKDFQIQSARPNGVYFDVKMNKYVEDYSYTILDEEVDTIISNLIPKQNTLRFYNTIPKDSIEAVITLIDTIGQIHTDTATIKFEPTQRKPDPISASITPPSASKIKTDLLATVVFNKPIRSVNLDSAFIYYDSLTIDSITLEDLSWNKLHDRLEIAKSLDPSLLIKKTLDTLSTTQIDTLPQTQTPKDSISQIEEPSEGRIGKRDRKATQAPTKNKFSKSSTQVILFLDRGTFIGVENDTVPEIIASYSFMKPEETAIIKGTLVTDKESFTIQLLTKSFELVEEIKNEKTFSFNHIPPGEYQMRILIDNDGDGKWFPGNILENKMPEEIYFYEEPIIIRANWERDLENIEF